MRKVAITYSMTTGDRYYTYDFHVYDTNDDMIVINYRRDNDERERNDDAHDRSADLASD